MCHYEYGIWNVAAGRVIERREVARPRSELGPEEIGSWGCTPCVEDQTRIELSNGVSFRICARVADRIQQGLERALKQGMPIETVVGYRPSMSRGPLDSAQNRTQFSNHAFGAAIDINEAHNGLYAGCPVWSQGCTLIRGGPWQPGLAQSLTADHPVVLELALQGFLWGGQIAGNQKDMMHFSETGY